MLKCKDIHFFLHFKSDICRKLFYTEVGMSICGYWAYRWLLRLDSGSRILPLRIGFISDKKQRAEIMRSALLSMKNEESYFLSLEPGHSFPWRPQVIVYRTLLLFSYKWWYILFLLHIWDFSNFSLCILQLRLLLCLHKKAAAADIVMGVLQVWNTNSASVQMPLNFMERRVSAFSNWPYILVSCSGV